MSEAFESIKQGLKEAIEYSKGEIKEAKIRQLSRNDVKAIRKKVNMTQADFALSFGISVATLRHWERGDRTPRGPAVVLLNIIDKAPQTVLELFENYT